MGIVKDAELRKGKAELVRALAAKGVVAQPYERLDVLAAKVAGAGGGGEPGGTPERFGSAVLVPPVPGLSVAALVSAPPTTWNPNDKNNITLSNSNLTATGPSTGFGVVRGIVGKSAGKNYFETTFSSESGNPAVGLAMGSFAVNGSRIGVDLAGLSIGWSCYNGQLWEAQNFRAAGGYSLGMVVGIGVDFSTHSVSLWLNGVQVGNGYTIGLSGVLYPAFSSDSPTVCNAVFGNVQYLPAGYSAWDS